MAEGEVRVNTTLTLDDLKKKLKEAERDVAKFSNSWKTADIKVQQLQEQMKRLSNTVNAVANSISSKLADAFSIVDDKSIKSIKKASEEYQKASEIGDTQAVAKAHVKLFNTISNEISQSGEQIKNAKNIYQEFFDYINKTKIDVPKFGKDWNNEIKKVFRPGTVSSEGMPFDTLFKELTGKFPHLFDETTSNIEDQVVRVVEVLKQGREAISKVELVSDEEIKEMFDIDGWDGVLSVIENAITEAKEELQGFAELPDSVKAVEIKANTEELQEVSRKLAAAKDNAAVLERAMNDAKASVSTLSKSVQELSISDALKKAEEAAEKIKLQEAIKEAEAIEKARLKEAEAAEKARLKEVEALKKVEEAVEKAYRKEIESAEKLRLKEAEAAEKARAKEAEALKKTDLRGTFDEDWAKIVEEKERQKQAEQELQAEIGQTTEAIDYQAESIDAITQGFQAAADNVRDSMSGIAEAVRSAFGDMTVDITDTYALIDTMKRQLQTLEAAGEAPKGLAAMRRELEANRRELDLVADKFKELKGHVRKDVGTTGAISPDTQAAIEQANREFDSITDNLERIANNAGIADNAIDNMADSAENITEPIEKATNSSRRQYFVIRALSRDFRNFGRSVRNTFANAVSTSARFLGNLLGINRNINSTNKAARRLSQSFGQLARRMIGLAATALIFNQIRLALRTLVKYINEANKANTEFVASMALLKGSSLAAFQPFYEVGLPVLISFVNWLARAVQYMAVFSSALFGFDPEQMKDNAKAIWENVQGLRAAEKAAKRTLAPFDELIIIGEQAAADTDVIAPDFDWDVPDISWIDEFVEKIEELQPDLEYFFELGDIFAQKIAEALDKIKWDDIQTWFAGKIQALAAFLNGIVANDAFWNALGNTIVEALRTLLIGANTFLETFTWYDFGVRIGEIFNKLIELLPSLGEILKNAIQAALDYANGVIDTFEWVDFGTNLAKLFEEITSELPSLGETLRNFIENALNGANAFLETFPWYDFGVNLAKFFNSLVETLPQLADTLGLTIKAALDTANGFIDTFEWYDFGAGLGDIFEAVISKLPEFGETLGNLLLGISDTINGFFDSVNWAEAGQNFSNGVINLFNGLRNAINNIEWQQIGEDIKTFLINIDWAGIIQAVFEVIIAAAQGIYDLLQGLIGQPMADMLISIASGILAFKAIDTIIPIITSAKDGILNLVESMKNSETGFKSLETGVAIAVAGLVLLIKNITDLIFNWDEMSAKEKIITGAFALIGAAAIVLGVSIAAGISAATLGIGALVAAAAAALTGIIAFIAKISEEEPAIKSTAQAAEDLAAAHENVAESAENVKEAQENLEQATEKVTDAQERLEEAENAVVTAHENRIKAQEELTSLSNEYINAVEKAEKAAIALEEAEKKLGISGEELAKQVAQGTLDFKDMDEAQREVYKAYMDNEIAQDKLNNTMTDFERIQANAEQAAKDLEKAEREVEKASKDVKKATEKQEEAQEKLILSKQELEKSIKAETEALWDNELAMAAQDKSFNKNGDSAQVYKDKVVDALKNGKIEAEDAQIAISKAMTGMSEDVRQAFTQDLPTDIKNGLDPEAYETTGQKITNWFKNVGENMIKGFKNIFGINSPSKEMIAIAGDISDGLTKGMDDKSYSIKTASSNVLSSITSTLSGGVSEMQEIGKNLANAISTGLENAKNFVVTTAQNIGNAITTGVQNIFGIHSPSRVFMQIGEYLGEGLAIGFENTENLTANAMADVIGSASDEINDFEQQGEEIGMSLLHGLESMYNPIVDFFKSLFDDIESISASFTVSEPQVPRINIPALSRNGILDPSTINIIADKGRNYHASQSNGIPQQESLRYLQHEQQMTNSLLQELISVMRSGQNINVDGQKLGRVTTSNQRSLARQFGESLLQY